MNYSKLILSVINRLKPLEPINSKKVYKEKFANIIPEGTYYKILERMTKANKIERIGKGIYCIPKKTEFGTITNCCENIVKEYTKNNSGMLVDYKMYFEKKLTTQVAKKICIFSNDVDFDKRTFNNVVILKKDIEFNEINKSIIRIFEVLENYNKIEEFNKANFSKMLFKYLEDFNDETVQKVLEKIKYKKRTIAFLKEILDVNKKDNSLNNYLSNLSKYEIPYEEIKDAFTFEQRYIQ